MAALSKQSTVLFKPLKSSLNQVHCLVNRAKKEIRNQLVEQVCGVIVY